MTRQTAVLIACALCASACDEAASGTEEVPVRADAKVGSDATATDANIGSDANREDSQDAGDLDARPIADAADEADADPLARDAAQNDSGEPDSAAPDQGSPPDASDEPRAFRGVYPIDADFTEGGIYDPVGHAFFVGSLGTGGVYRIDAETGAQSTLFEPVTPGTWWSLGMDVDVVENRLYVCGMDDRRDLGEEHDFAGYLWGFDLDTGEQIFDRALRHAEPGGTCTDVAVAEDGTVYINDRENPRLYALTLDGELNMIVENDALSGRVVGQNALLVLPDQSALLSLVYLPSRLVRISLPGLRVTVVDVDGDFFDGLPALSGADGMAISGDSVLVAFSSQLNRLRPVLADWSSVESETVDVPNGMTDVVNTPGGDYLLNGQSVRFALGQNTDPSQLVRFEGDL